MPRLLKIGPRIYGSLVLVVLLATACAKVLGIKDAVVEPMTCGYSTSNSCLQQCIDTSCCSETDACMNDSSCSGLVSCSSACGSSDSACLSGCISTYPEAAAAFVTMSACLDSCGCDATGTGGTSGQGGSTGTGTTSVGGAAVGGAASVGPVLAAAITRFAETDCNRYQACAPGWVAMAYGSVTECVNRSILENEWIATLPGVGWTASNFIACGNAWAASSCLDYMNSVLQPDCIVKGTLALGRPCNSNYQCASLMCDTDGTFCGACVAAPAVGDACVRGACAGGLSCSTNNLCQKPRGLREACSADYPCQYRFDCVQGQCALPSGTTGAACNSATNLNCDTAQNYVCALTTNTCVPVTQYMAVGQSCGVNASNTSATRCSGGSCGDGGTCVARAADGAICDDSVGPYCEWPAFCSNGYCQLESDTSVCQ